MSKHAIIIGFSYNNELPGSNADINNMINYCNKFNYSYNIINDDINNIKDFELSLILFIKTFCTNTSKYLTKNFLVYYTGHGRDDSIVLPNKDLYSFTKFKNVIIKAIPNLQTEIFWILDCCNPTGLHLPFKLINNSFHFQKQCEFNCPPNIKILLITSSDNNEKSISTINGSLFTNQLLLLLNSLNDNLLLFISNYNKDNTIIPVATNRNLNRFINNLSANIRAIQHEYRQNVSIYSSYIIDPILWFWITTAGNHKTVRSHSSLNALSF